MRKRQGKLDAELDRLSFIPLLVFDEVGYIPFDPQAASLMFIARLPPLRARVDDRHLATSRSAWGEIFGDDMAATAMIDRLIHHAEILSLKGDTYRLRGKELDARPAARPPKSADRYPSAGLAEGRRTAYNTPIPWPGPVRRS